MEYYGEDSESSGGDLDVLWGYGSVLLAILSFGSFAVPLRGKKFVEAKCHPVILQLYFSSSVLLTSFIQLAITGWDFSWWGWLGAFCWVVVSISSFVAIAQIGMAVPQAVWSGVTIIVSFLWGIILFDEGTNNLSLAIVGLLLMVIGIAGASLCNFQFSVTLPSALRCLYVLPFLETTTYTEIGFEDGRKSPVINDEEWGENGEKQGPTRMNYIIGLTVSILMGIPNGSMLVPTKIDGVPQGVAYLISFGTGVYFFTLVLVGSFQIFKKASSGQFESLKYRSCALPGLAAGCLFSSGNFFSIYATQFLGLTIGFPLTQTALLVSGLWGLFFFKEITRTGAQVMFFTSALVIIGGAVMLSLFG